MTTVLITGANGFVGHYLAEQLIGNGHRVVATGKGPSRLPFGGPLFQYETLDITEPRQVTDVLAAHRPQVVVHAAALSKPDECALNQEAAFRTNVTGTLLLLGAAARINSFFVFLSTDFVFDGSRLDYREEDQPAPVNYYGQTKVLAEEEVRKYAGRWSIVRPIMVYGHPRSGKHNILTLVADALRKGDSPQIVNDQTRKPTYVEDLAGGLVAVIEGTKQGIFHLCGPDALTPYGMACAVADHLKLDAGLIRCVTQETFRQPALRPPVTGFDLAKAERELGYRPVPFAEGLRKTFQAAGA